MKRALITLGLSAGLLLGLASAAAGATSTRLQMLNEMLYPDTSSSTTAIVTIDSDLHLRFIDDVLYPQQITWLDFICDGTAPCTALPGSHVVPDATTQAPAMRDVCAATSPCEY